MGNLAIQQEIDDLFDIIWQFGICTLCCDTPPPVVGFPRSGVYLCLTTPPPGKGRRGLCRVELEHEWSQVIEAV